MSYSVCDLRRVTTPPLALTAGNVGHLQLMDYNENFRLFMVTRNPKPELPPDASALVCEVNFTVTRFARNTAEA